MLIKAMLRLPASVFTQMCSCRVIVEVNPYSRKLQKPVEQAQVN